MKKIKLTRGQFALVDDEDFYWLNQFKWQAFWNIYTKSFYATRSERIGINKRKTTYMARIIMKPINGMVVDHINHNTLDNRKSNLRNVTKSQNSMNKRAHSNNVTGLKGVTKTTGGFMSRIMKEGKSYYLGFFHTAEDAYVAYQKEAEKLFGKNNIMDNKD